MLVELLERLDDLVTALLEREDALGLLDEDLDLETEEDLLLVDLELTDDLLREEFREETDEFEERLLEELADLELLDLLLLLLDLRDCSPAKADVPMRINTALAIAIIFITLLTEFTSFLVPFPPNSFYQEACQPLRSTTARVNVL